MSQFKINLKFRIQSSLEYITLGSRKTNQRPLIGHALSFCSVTACNSSSREIQCLCTHSRKHTHTETHRHMNIIKNKRISQIFKKTQIKLGWQAKWFSRWRCLQRHLSYLYLIFRAHINMETENQLHRIILWPA